MEWVDIAQDTEALEVQGSGCLVRVPGAQTMVWVPEVRIQKTGRGQGKLVSLTAGSGGSFYED